MQNKRIWRRVVPFAISICLGLCGCTTTTTQSLRATDNPEIDASYIAVGADFGKYRQLVADDMGIFFPSGTPLTDDDVQRLRDIFRSAFLAELKAYRIVDRPGPDTLKVQASLIDVKNSPGAIVPNLRKELRDIVRPESLLFLMELRDSETDEVLGRAADSAVTPAFATAAGSTTDWSSVERAARHWAALFRQFLDDNLGR